MTELKKKKKGLRKTEKDQQIAEASPFLSVNIKYNYNNQMGKMSKMD